VENSPVGFSGEKPNGAGATQTTSATFFIEAIKNTTRRRAAGSAPQSGTSQGFALRYDAALRGERE